MNNCARKFTSINLMSFCYFLMRKRAKSHVKIWDSHENLMKSLMRSSWNNQNLMRKRLKNHVKTKISWDSHEIWWKAHENLMRIFAFFSFLMRISWDSHENLQNLTRIFVREKRKRERERVGGGGGAPYIVYTPKKDAILLCNLPIPSMARCFLVASARHLIIVFKLDACNSWARTRLDLPVSHGKQTLRACCSTMKALLDKLDTQRLKLQKGEL